MNYDPMVHALLWYILYRMEGGYAFFAMAAVNAIFALIKGLEAGL